MIVASTPSALKEHLAALRTRSVAVSFVPTMGNLHAGHLALMQQARQSAEVVVASIFVNPMQFAENEDLATYPRTMDADLAALREAGVDKLSLLAASSSNSPLVSGRATFLPTSEPR